MKECDSDLVVNYVRLYALVACPVLDKGSCYKLCHHVKFSMQEILAVLFGSIIC